MWRLLSTTVRWLVVLSLFAASALGNDPCGIDFPHDTNPTEITDEDICNFHQVDADAYRGGRPRPSAYPKLVKLGIRTIVNLEQISQAETEKAVLTDLNKTLKPEERVGFISFPIDDHQIALTGVSDRQIHNLFEELHDARKPIFIHCYHGKDRTGAVVVLFRMARQEKSFKDAYEEALHYKFSKLDLGLKKTIGRYRTSKPLESLPRP